MWDVKQASPSLPEFATEKVMDGHGMRSQERAAHFGQISYGTEKVTAEQHTSGWTSLVPHIIRWGIEQKHLLRNSLPRFTLSHPLSIGQCRVVHNNQRWLMVLLNGASIKQSYSHLLALNVLRDIWREHPDHLNHDFYLIRITKKELKILKDKVVKRIIMKIIWGRPFRKKVTKLWAFFLRGGGGRLFPIL